MSNRAVAVFINNGGQLLKHETTYAAASALASNHQVIGLWIVQDMGDPPQEFWTEFSGNDMYTIEYSNTEQGVLVRVGDTGPDSTRVKLFRDNGTGDPIRTLPVKLSQAGMIGTGWDVYTGNDYDDQLDAARILAGVPT